MKKDRNTNIEILKIVAICMIILSHSLPRDVVVCGAEWYIDIHKVTRNLSDLVVILFNYLGQIGNAIFCVCSAFYLLENDYVDRRKVFGLWIDTEIISVLWCIILIPIIKNLSTISILKVIFPITFETYWFVTCYIFMYSIHGFLNIIINTVDKRKLLKINCLLVFVYMILNSLIPFEGEYYYSNNLMAFIVIYFLVSYVKKYGHIFRMSQDKLYFLLVGVSILIIGEILITNILGFKFEAFASQMLHWANISNPFIVLWALIIFAIVNKHTYKGLKFINSISSLSLLIYLIHANPLYSGYIRPLYWDFVYRKYNYKYVILYVLFLTFIQIIGSTLLAFYYRKIIRRIKSYIVLKIDMLVSRAIDFVEKIVDKVG